MAPAEPAKPLGKPRGSLNSPIAAFTMAVLLGSYCIASMRSARDTTNSPPGSGSGPGATTPGSDSSSAPQPAFSFSFREKQPRKTEQPAWMQEAIEASREDAQKRGK